MGFSPTYDNLDPREPWLNIYYNTIVDDIQLALSTLNFSDFADASLVLSRPNQELDGGNKNIHSFKRWFGPGSDDTKTLRDVYAFGAVGNDVADDSAAIQAAIDDLSTTGGIVFFPPGNFRIGTQLSITNNNVVLMGSGWASRIAADDNLDDDLLQIAGDGSVIYNLKMDGRKAAQGAGDFHGINPNTATNTLIWRCWVLDTKGSGIDINGVTNLLIEKCRFSGITDNGILVSSGAAASTNVQILSNFIDTCGVEGIGMTGAPSDLRIEGNRIKDCGSEGILVQTSATVSVQDVLINENVCDNNGAAGIKLLSGGGTSQIRDVHIIGNTSKNNTGAGIHLRAGSGVEIEDVSIAGNKIRDNDLDGIHLEFGIEHVSISANTLKNNNGTGGTAGINCDGQAGALIEDVVITGNSIQDDQGSPTMTYGIIFDQHTEQCGAFGNAVRGATTANIEDNGTDNDVSHNMGT